MELSDLYLEKNISQRPALELLVSLGYQLLSPAECSAQRGSRFGVLLNDSLRGQLRRLNRYTYGGAVNEFSAENVERAIRDLSRPPSEGLLHSGERVYNMLMLGQSYPETVGEGRALSFNLNYIDWEHPENNLFQATWEFSVESADGEFVARPDIVLFVNGIPFATIECKAPGENVNTAVEETVRNQQAGHIPHLFHSVQLVMASNVNEVRYATAGTAKKFWNVWKEQDEAFLAQKLEQCVRGREPTEQDRCMISLFAPERVLELMRYFVLFDGRVKKVCRYQQFFAVREIMNTISHRDEAGRRQGGVIWHTQGSGKSLTMAMVAKRILMELSACHPRVVLVTDRRELDAQIASTFSHTRLSPARATSGRHLVDLIAQGRADIVTTVINKFDTAQRLKTRVESPDVFVLVDEGHRSNSGLLHTKMKLVFPNACYIAFTGTPLMKSEKNTIARFGGRLIHTYTIKDGVDDKVIVPLIYEGRLVEQNVDEKNIDLWFEQETRRLSDEQREELRKKWSSIRRLSSTDERIKRIALDIENHFVMNYLDTGFKAMLATNYKRDAVRYLECFEQFGDLRCAVVISAPDLREGAEDIDEGADDKVQLFWKRMMDQYGDADRYEEAVKNAFLDGEIDILIVCGKLLTGFDAPRCQVLYIDKELKEHGLLQAIARTNRLYEGKDYGLIVDYRGLIRELDEAMTTYSGAGLEGFDGGDLKGVAVDVSSAVGDLRSAYSQLQKLFEGVDLKDVEAVEVWLADEERRKSFYALLCAFGKALSLVLGSDKAYGALTEAEARLYQGAFAFFSKVRRSVKIRYAEALDNAEYERKMQSLLDRYLSVEDLRPITQPVDVMNKEDFARELEKLGTARSKADAIRSALTKSISSRFDENPAYYMNFSKRIRDALDKYRDQVISDAEYYVKMQEILADYGAGKSSVQYPQRIKNDVNAQAFYGVICAQLDGMPQAAAVDADFAAEIAQEITQIVASHSQVDWSENRTIHNRIAQDIDDLFFRYEKERGLKLPFETVDKIIENVKTVALRRF
ncbi:MAG: type I restriction endonuclease subunit R [Pyramidobacter sp.]|nr:type I restriction endonuclease subunit R [Pyramidobacter sp.]